MLEINLFIIIILLSKMGQQHSYLQNQAVVDSGHGLVYFQDLFSLAGPGGMKLDFQNQNSIEATAAAGANAAVMAATGHLQNQMSIGGGGMKFEFQNLYDKCKHAAENPGEPTYMMELYQKKCGGQWWWPFLQNQMSIGGGGMKLEFQNQNAVATAAAGANAAVMAATGNLQNQFSLSGPGGLKISVL